MTHDKRFMIKTIKKSELKIMLDILPHYIQHNLKYPDSLIGKIFGVFTVKREGSSPIYLALMENTTQYNPSMLRYKFDLKGSTLGRKTKGVVTSKTDRKDLDWLELKEKKTKLLEISAINKPIGKILRRDVNFLKNHGLIDYSLLLAIEISAEKFKPNKVMQDRLRANLFLNGGNRRNTTAVMLKKQIGKTADMTGSSLTPRNDIENQRVKNSKLSTTPTQQTTSGMAMLQPSLNVDLPRRS